MKTVKRGLAALFALALILTAGCGKKGGVKVVDYKIDIPAGFEEGELEGAAKYWANADGANVSVNITEAGAAFEKVTADALRSALEQDFEAIHGVKPTITDQYFTSDTVCEMPAYQYCYAIELMGREMTQLIVCIDAGKAYTITYTDTTGGWLSEFEASARNIQLITE